jgi:hypothetical protein
MFIMFWALGVYFKDSKSPIWTLLVTGLKNSSVILSFPVSFYAVSVLALLN